MKALKNVCLVFVFLFAATTIAQENYTVNGSTYSLKTEVEGPLTLLWNVIDNEYRYFAKKDNAIIELRNTRVNGKYQEEYKQTLRELTADNSVVASKTNLTLVSLRNYFIPIIKRLIRLMFKKKLVLSLKNVLDFLEEYQTIITLQMSQAMFLPRSLALNLK